MGTDLTDTSIINDIELKEAPIRVMAWYNSITSEMKEINVNDHWSLRMISWPWWNGVNNDILNDAWGRPKVTNDFSLFHGLWTYNIPSQLWLLFENGSEVTSSTEITSTDWALVVSSWTTTNDERLIRSKRHPRYQPNRWHLWSTAWFIPTPSATWIRKWGLINTATWVYFQLEDWTLYAVIYNDSTEKSKVEIDLSTIGLTVADLAYGTLYDIQYQWRWVWDYYFYINQKLVYNTSFLWTNTELTTFNPALSSWFYCKCTDWTDVSMKFGCVDITSEWGQREWATYVSVANAATKAVNTADYPAIIVHIKSTINSVPNTRDVLALSATWSSDQKSYMKAYLTRDATALTWASFNDAVTWSWIEFDVAATAIDTAKCQLLWNRRVQVDNNTSVDLPSDLIDFVLSEWDYLIITMERENPTLTANVVVSLELGEEI